jgi:N-acetylmuramoyl-L-alanine amidase
MDTVKRVIAIDPGHGGVDPGTVGGSGTYEKHITLSMAREIRDRLQATGRYKVVLTRDRDIFVRLRDRIAVSREAGAELFVSIHADAIENRRIRGLSVYTLSEKASDKEAAALAEKENKADLIAGIDLTKETPEVTNILIDLAQRESMNQSARFAARLVKELARETKLLRNTHRFAGFVVLKAPDVPSVLMELGFLSNRQDEAALKRKSYRAKLIAAMARASDAYFSRIEEAVRP